MSGRRLLAVVAAVLALSGCAVGRDTAVAAAAAPPAPVSPPPVGDQGHDPAVLIAALRTATDVRARPGGPFVRRLGLRTDEGSVQRLLVVDDRTDWLQVLLPGRPLGQTGWLPAGSVDLTATDYRLRISLSAHTVTLLRSLLPVHTWSAAVGAAGTPTPTGLFYVTDLLRPPSPAGPYGPYAFGLSAYSRVLTSFGRGRGQIGLHGTDQPEMLGRSVSHGCVRVSNAVIRELASELPLGTPVDISA
jgi:lipoprotein-anchoring transpeptidase ErfK/SrfK